MSLPPVVALDLATLRLAADEIDLIKYHLTRLGIFRSHNETRQAYYEGSIRVRNLGISLPPSLEGKVETVVGWPATVVDVPEERLDFLGWTSDDGDAFGLDEVYRDNSLDGDISLGLLDALIYGTAFVAVGRGEPDEPSPLITVESPMVMTGEYDGRKRRLSSALSIDEVVNGHVTRVTLYLPHANITADRTNGTWLVADRDDHGLGRVTVAQLVNRPRASRLGGRSEITRAIMSYTDQAVRTLLGMAVSSEFYSAPQRWVMGADGGSFRDADGNVKTGWEAIIGRVLAMPKDEDGDKPSVGQFNPASPAPYLEQIRGLRELVSAEAAIPGNYLGNATENPPSADAIRAMEARLIKRVERRQAIFGRSLREVGALALLVRDGSLPADFSRVSIDWRDAATPTRSAAADEATKLIAAGVLPADSKVTYDRIGLSPAEQRQLESDKRKANARAAISALSAAAQAARQEPGVSDAETRTGAADGNVG